MNPQFLHFARVEFLQKFLQSRAAGAVARASYPALGRASSVPTSRIRVRKVRKCGNVSQRPAASDGGQRPQCGKPRRPVRKCGKAARPSFAGVRRCVRAGDLRAGGEQRGAPNHQVQGAQNPCQQAKPNRRERGARRPSRSPGADRAHASRVRHVQQWCEFTKFTMPQRPLTTAPMRRNAPSCGLAQEDPPRLRCRSLLVNRPAFVREGQPATAPNGRPRTLRLQSSAASFTSDFTRYTVTPFSPSPGG